MGEPATISPNSAARDGSFEIGRVVVDAFRRLVGNPVALVFIAAAGWAVLFGLGRLERQLFPSRAALRLARADHIGSRGWAIVVTAGVVGMVVGALFEFASTRVVLAEPPSLIHGLMDALRATLRATPTLVVVVVATNLPFVIDLFVPYSADVLANIPRETALAAGGLAIYVLVGPAIPVLAAERPGPLDTIRRAVQLVNRHRWSFFAVWLMTLPLAIISGLILTLSLSFVHPAKVTVAITVIQALLGRLNALVGVALTAAAYRELTRIKDGWRPTDTADVFE